MNAKKAFKLRPAEDYYVMPGHYEFKANVNKDNSNLLVVEAIAAGDDKAIVFDLIETVHTTFRVIDQASGKKLRQHQELWQDDELKYKIHVHNGSRIVPGTYKLVSRSFATPYVIEKVEVPATDRQTLEFALTFGIARITYRFHTEPDRKGRRCWLFRVDDAGNRGKERSRALNCDGSENTLAEGMYSVRSWSELGQFEDTVFEVRTGQTAVVEVLQK